MRIENLNVEERDAGRRVRADVIFETAARPPLTLYFELPYPFAEDLEPNAEAFLLAALPVAVWWGERRIRIEARLCTRFRDGARAAMAVYARWFPRCRPLSIEPSDGYAPTTPRAPQRTASLLSGGVDGLAALRANRLDYPRRHPAAISDCILLFGANDFDCTASGPVPERLAMFRQLQSRLQDLAADEDFELIPVETNTRVLCGDYTCWTSVAFGAANVSVAHALSRRFDRVLFASDGLGVDPPPAASHPLLDQHYSTAAVTVRHEQASWSRIDKLRLLADWPAALRLMQPCHRTEVLAEGRVNCGRCEKCVRTMLGLLALGKLREADAFRENDVTPEMVARIPLHNSVKAALLSQLVDPVCRAGRDDLARAIRGRVARFLRRERLRKLTPPLIRRARRSLLAVMRSP